MLAWHNNFLHKSLQIFVNHLKNIKLFSDYVHDPQKIQKWGWNKNQLFVSKFTFLHGQEMLSLIIFVNKLWLSFYPSDNLLKDCITASV